LQASHNAESRTLSRNCTASTLLLTGICSGCAVRWNIVGAKLVLLEYFKMFWGSFERLPCVVDRGQQILVILADAISSIVDQRFAVDDRWCPRLRNLDRFATISLHRLDCGSRILYRSVDAARLQGEDRFCKIRILDCLVVRYACQARVLDCRAALDSRDFELGVLG